MDTANYWVLFLESNPFRKHFSDVLFV